MWEIEPKKGITLTNCNHTFCMNCIKNHIACTSRFNCPKENSLEQCNGKLENSEISYLFPGEKLDELKLYHDSKNNFIIVQCFVDNCNGNNEIDKNEDEFLCQLCSLNNCRKCEVCN